MRFCLHAASCGLAALAALPAAGIEIPAQIETVVRADARSGRLVRTVAAPSRAVPGREIKPRTVDASSGASARETQVAAGTTLGRFIEQTALRYQVDPLLVHSVIQVESNYNPFAVSPKGAQGMMQLMPGTATRFGVTKVFNPWQNIEGGVRYLRYLLTLFRSERLALAAYNAGEAAVFKYGNIPPYPETQSYVYNVGKRYGQAKKAAERARPATPPPAPEHPPIVEYTDAAGVLHLRTQITP